MQNLQNVTVGINILVLVVIVLISFIVGMYQGAKITKISINH